MSIPLHIYRTIKQRKNIMPNNSKEAKLEAFSKLLDVVDELRQKCPWDRKQTNLSLRENTIEETYELTDALLKDRTEDIRKELGDVLLHILFYSKIGDEKEQFDIADVCDSLREKLIYRHPHIYGNIEANTTEAVLQNWEQLKLKEKSGNKSVLAGVPEALPSLIRAYRIQQKTSSFGFDWQEPRDVWAKVKEEIAEVEEALAEEDTTAKADHVEEEFGDLLFSLVNAARLYKVHPDTALTKCNDKFTSRFNYVEQRTKDMGKSLKDMTLEEMDELWNEAKVQLKKQQK